MHSGLTKGLIALSVLALLAPTLALARDWDDGRRNSPYLEEIEGLGDNIVEDLPIPVLVGVELNDLTKNFGDPRDGGTRTHEGLDIIATDGTPVASPTEAVVLQIGDGPDSGLYIRTANPGDETFVYMHLSKIAEDLDEGDEVKRGEVIGFVGNTGNASGGHAHLHFEIREDSEPTDPYPRLTEVFSTAEREAGLEQALEQGGDDDLIALLERQLSGSDDEPEEDEDATTRPAKATIAYGQTSSGIVDLQKFLIAANSGDSSARLKNTGATGYFGPLTEAAVREYQRVTNLEVTGVVDNKTYALVFAQQNEPTTPDEEEEPDTPSSSGVVFTRDLEVGVEGTDVRALQEFLNENGYVLATEGPGSPGSETTMFGALTRAALTRYQAANKISPAVGYFGPITRAHIATLTLQ